MPDTTEPTSLPPFSGDNPTCPKCAGRGAYTRYFNHRGRVWIDYTDAPRVAVEHLQRECARCGFTWPEDIARGTPADAAPEPAVQLVVRGGIYAVHVDDPERAVQQAAQIGGVVVELPVTADHRKTSNPPERP